MEPIRLVKKTDGDYALEYDVNFGTGREPEWMEKETVIAEPDPVSQAFDTAVEWSIYLNRKYKIEDAILGLSDMLVLEDKGLMLMSRDTLATIKLAKEALELAQEALEK